MPLKTYQQKRDFKKTAEPKGSKKLKKSKDKIFVIHKHAASHLHYDLRLEMDGVLKSWAVPKGPSLDPTVKRLAVHVEDHPYDYRTFEGIIPKGQYGGGTVMLWDEGTWAESEDPKGSYKKGNLKFSLKGKKLKGEWKLIQIKSDPKNWLLIKANDKYARSQDEYDITLEKTRSVLSKKSMEGIAKAAGQPMEKKVSKKPAKKPASKPKAAAKKKS
jgi:bifunctional non-homologous end joining protein LigD